MRRAGDAGRPWPPSRRRWEAVAPLSPSVLGGAVWPRSLCLPGGCLLWLSSSVLSLLRPDHLCERLKPVRRLDAAAGQGRQESAEQTRPVSDDPDPIDLNDED
jgi:hypothetical protein